MPKKCRLITEKKIIGKKDYSYISMEGAKPILQKWLLKTWLHVK